MYIDTHSLLVGWVKLFVTFYFILNIVMHLMFYHQIWDEFVFLWDLFSRNWLDNGCSWFDIVKKNTYANKWSFKLIPQVSNFLSFILLM